jgi:hypothetical protein
MGTAGRFLAAVIAPASLIAALLYFFGRLHATSFFAYFGVHFTVFDLDTLAYLVRSQDGLFMPLTLAGLGALLVIWGNRILGPRLPERMRRNMRRAARPVAALAGLIGLGIALFGVIVPTIFAPPVVAPGLGLAAGAVLLSIATRPSNRDIDSSTSTVVEWVGAYVLIGVGLFWAVGNYSTSLGVTRAKALEAALNARPSVVLVSEKDLGLAGVRAVTCAASAVVRYDDLVLVIQAGGQYLLLPRDWTRANGPAILLPKSDGLRLEFRSQPPLEPGTPTDC